MRTMCIHLILCIFVFFIPCAYILFYVFFLPCAYILFFLPCASYYIYTIYHVSSYIYHIPCTSYYIYTIYHVHTSYFIRIYMYIRIFYTYNHIHVCFTGSSVGVRGTPRQGTCTCAVTCAVNHVCACSSGVTHVSYESCLL